MEEKRWQHYGWSMGVVLFALKAALSILLQFFGLDAGSILIVPDVFAALIVAHAYSVREKQAIPKDVAFEAAAVLFGLSFVAAAYLSTRGVGSAEVALVVLAAVLFMGLLLAMISYALMRQFSSAWTKQRKAHKQRKGGGTHGETKD